jgi:hypothetical protein
MMAGAYPYQGFNKKYFAGHRVRPRLRDRNIDPSFREMTPYRGAVRADQFGPDMTKFAIITSEYLCDVVMGVNIGRADDDDILLMFSIYPLDDFVVQIEQLERHRVQDFPKRGQRKTALGSLEERSPDLQLKLLDLLTDGRLHPVQMLRRS